MKAGRVGQRAFSHARGVRLAGTNIACDAVGTAGGLVFLSHALALVGAGGGRAAGSAGFPRSFGAALPRGGRQEVLATEATLSLLGRAGESLRRRALPASFGRPFALGEHRVELFPSGYLPGAASLLVEGTRRRTVYAGSVRLSTPAFGAPPAEIRRADAICLDATFGHPRFELPPPAEALAVLRTFVEETLESGRAPVLLLSPFAAGMEAASFLVKAGFSVRGHRSMLAAAALYKKAGLVPPAIPRFAAKLGEKEVLLWPPEARRAPLLGTLPRARFAFVSGFSLDPRAVAEVGADCAVPLSNQGGYADLLAYIEATGAREVAVFRGHAEHFAETLREKGLFAYAIGPARQMELFRG